MRWRIQVWHGLILLLVVAGFGSVFYVRLERGRMRQIDTELETAAAALTSILRSLPPWEVGAPDPFGRERPFPPGFGPPRKQGGPRGAGGRPEPKPDRPPDSRQAADFARLMSNMRLPDSFQDRNRAAKPYFAVWRGDGELMRQAPPAPKFEPGPPPEFSSPKEVRFSWNGENREIRMAGPGGSSLLVGRSAQRELAELDEWLLLTIVSGTSVLVLGLVGGLWISHRALQPLRAMSTTAAAISAKNLSRRIDTTNVDQELRELAETLNATFARLESEFERQARFTADASHELRTPLTVILGQLELALGADSEADEDPEERRETIAACLRAAKRMKSLVDQLLLLTRADFGKLVPDRQPFDLGAAVEECVDLLTPLARKKGVTIRTEIESVECHGDPELAAQVAVNLVTNAIAHNRDGGEVVVQVTSDGPFVVLVVADNGPGIAEADLPHIFERFYRVDAARSRKSGGAGLGLAITRSIVHAHQGEIRCQSQVGQGARFEVRLPSVVRHLSP